MRHIGLASTARSSRKGCEMKQLIVNLLEVTTPLMLCCAAVIRIDDCYQQVTTVALSDARVVREAVLIFEDTFYWKPEYLPIVTSGNNLSTATESVVPTSS